MPLSRHLSAAIDDKEHYFLIARPHSLYAVQVSRGLNFISITNQSLSGTPHPALLLDQVGTSGLCLRSCDFHNLHMHLSDPLLLLTIFSTMLTICNHSYMYTAQILHFLSLCLNPVSLAFIIDSHTRAFV